MNARFATVLWMHCPTSRSSGERWDHFEALAFGNRSVDEMCQVYMDAVVPGR